MIGEASSMVVTRRSSRLRVFRGAAPAFARGVWVHTVVQSCSSVLLGLAAIGVVAVVAVLLLGGARPAWWRDGPAALEDGVSRTERARKVDNNSWSVVTQVRPMAADAGKAGLVQSEPWSVSLSAESATAWLNEKLPQWLLAQEKSVALPLGAEMRAVFEPGVVRLGVRFVSDGGGERYAALMITPRVDERGLWLPASSASLGRLEVPVGAVIAGGHGGGGDGGGGEAGARSALSRELAAVLRGEAPALPGAALKLPDGRRVRLLKFEVLEDRLVLTMRTEAGAARNGQMTNGQSAK